jgi:hypothetical protein
MNIRPDFLTIPFDLYENDQITSLDRDVYAIIYFFSKMRNEKCTAGNETIADILRVSAGSVSNSLTKLEEEGFVKRLFDDPATKKVRKEIVPLVFMGKFSKKEVSSHDDTRFHRTMNQVSSHDEHISNSNKGKEWNSSFSKKNSPQKSRMTVYDETKSSDSYEEAIDADSGEELAGEERAEGRNFVALRLNRLFSKKAEKETGVKPVSNKKGYTMLCRLLKDMSEEELSSLMDDWFDEPLPDEELIQVTRCLSSYNVNKWRVEND